MSSTARFESFVLDVARLDASGRFCSRSLLATLACSHAVQHSALRSNRDVEGFGFVFVVLAVVAVVDLIVVQRRRRARRRSGGRGNSLFE